MPPPAYTSRRRLVMQAVMVVLLGATVGLAAWVRQRKLDAPPPLRASLELVHVTVQLPAGWRVREPPAEPLIRHLVAEERSRESKEEISRRIDLIEERLLFAGASADEYLRDALKLDVGGAKPIKFAGQQGLRVSASDTNPPDQGWTSVYAVAILPERVALTLKMSVKGRAFSDKDEALFEAVLSSVTAGVPEPMLRGSIR